MNFRLWLSKLLLKASKRLTANQGVIEAEIQDLVEVMGKGKSYIKELQCKEKEKKLLREAMLNRTLSQERMELVILAEEETKKILDLNYRSPLSECLTDESRETKLASMASQRLFELGIQSTHNKPTVQDDVNS